MNVAVLMLAVAFGAAAVLARRQATGLLGIIAKPMV
jgi:hypothetical protein